jgi:hypothetical protein
MGWDSIQIGIQKYMRSHPLGGISFLIQNRATEKSMQMMVLEKCK